jgi:hypothetical protein
LSCGEILATHAIADPDGVEDLTSLYGGSGLEPLHFSIVGRQTLIGASTGPGKRICQAKGRPLLLFGRGAGVGENLMSIQMVLLPVFVLVGLTFFLLLWMVAARTRAVKARETSIKDIAAGQPKYPARVAQIGNCFANQFEVPVLFYFLIALALPLRRADLFIVLMSWVFVVTRFAHAGIFVTTNNIQQRSLAWFAGVLVLLAMWIYFALKLLLLL